MNLFRLTAVVLKVEEVWLWLTHFFKVARSSNPRLYLRRKFYAVFCLLHVVSILIGLYLFLVDFFEIVWKISDCLVFKGYFGLFFSYGALCRWSSCQFSESFDGSLVFILQSLSHFLKLIVFLRKCSIVFNRIYQLKATTMLLFVLFPFITFFLFQALPLFLSHSFLPFQSSLFKLLSFFPFELVFLWNREVL